MQFKLKVLCTLLFCSITLFSQAQKYTLSGIVSDSLSSDPVDEVIVHVKGTSLGTASDTTGYYSIQLPKGSYQVEFYFIGYKPVTIPVEVNGNTTLNVILPPDPRMSKNVDIKNKAPKAEENVQSTKMGVVEIDVKQIQKLPAMFGEVDVLKNLQTMPGVQVAGEGNTGLYVRGGGTDQNLILYDEAPIYSASHLLGIFSVFNADPLKTVELYKGGIPSAYGGRLSSLLDIKTRDGNFERFKMNGGIGLISSRLTVEAPLFKKNASFLASGRRTYGDLFLKLSGNEEVRNNTLYFYDLNFKYTHLIDDKNTISYSGYFGRDVFKFQDFFKLSWGNSTSSIRWKHVFSKRLSSVTSAFVSDYQYNQLIDIDPTQNFTYKTRITEYGAKQDFTHTLNEKHKLNYGAQLSYRVFNPGLFEPVGDQSIFTTIEMQRYHATEGAVYIADQFNITKRWLVDYGIRASGFMQLGPGDYYTYNGEVTANNISDTTTYGTMEAVGTWGGLEPRISARYLLNESSSIKASYNRMKQYIHLVANSLSPVPFSIWIPSTNQLAPETADQVAIGYFKNFKDNTYEFSAETYYKSMKNVVDFLDNADLLVNPLLETQIRSGKGWSYGAELFVKKNKGKTTGWVSYTLSWAYRQTPSINNGEKYYASYDRRNNLNIVMSHDFNDRVNFSATWVYGTGRPIGIPGARFEFENAIGGVYPERNSSRLKAYHRMDVAVTLNSKKKEGRKWESSWNFSIYNVYMRKNPFTVFTQNKPDHPGEKELVMIYFPTPIPSVTYNFKF